MTFYCSCLTESNFSTLGIHCPDFHSLESLQQECFAESHSEAVAVAIAEHMKMLLVSAELCSRQTPAEFPAEGRDVLSPEAARGLAKLEVKAVILAHSSSLEQPQCSLSPKPKESSCFLPVLFATADGGGKLEDGRETGI